MRVFVKPGRPPESTIGRKWGARARQLSPECICPGKSRDFEIAREGAEKGGQPPSGCRIHGAPPVPPAHRRATAFNTWFLGRPEIFDCGVWAAPKARETIRKRMGGDAPHICQWFPGPPVPPRDPPKTMLSSRPENPVLIKKRRQIDRPHSAIWFANWSLAGEEGDPANENFRELIRSGSGERAISE